MISISNLRKTFGTTVAIDIPSLTVNDGEILGLVGNNGAGKTTLFRLMLDLLKADDGEITLTVSGGDTPRSIAIAHSEEWKQHTGAYLDEGFLIDFFTPEEYFSFLGKISDMSQEAVDARLKTFDVFTGGEIFGQKKLIRSLSAGNKQKVGIIAAFLTSPDVIILDEPFNFLDPTSQNTLKRLIVDYNRDSGKTVIISSHNLSHTVDISSRIVLLEHGKVIRDIPNNDAEAAAEVQSYFECH